MPNIIVKIPEGVFDDAGRRKLAAGLTRAASAVEQMSEDPRQQFLTWVTIEETRSGYLFAGGADPLAQVIPVVVFFQPPAGVVAQDRRQLAITLMHEACLAAKPEADPRVVMTSILIQDVPDGSWGANGALWHLPDFARASGYRHLQHLVT
jgi:phenylpyruvate tautomerase PptA (4-oxalocrotonate tautomerase family)